MGTYHILTGYFLPVDKKEVQMQYFPSPLTIITRILMSGCLPFWRLRWSVRWVPPWLPTALPRASALDFEVRLGPLAGLGRCLVLGPEQELQFREPDIRDSSQAGSWTWHDASVNNRIFLEDSVIIIDRWRWLWHRFWYLTSRKLRRTATDSKQTVEIMRQDLDCVVWCCVLCSDLSRHQ